ncbi:MAG TPA: hypothetical protein VFG53_02805 [Anaeromyxobacter sp.]|nr:hypothetical protein [Anaeromyxobacter sp.]
MFIGHYGVAFAAKRFAPRTSLAVLFAASLLCDLLWPVLLLCGVESVRIDPGNTAMTPLDFERYPWSHSAAMTVLYSVVFALLLLASTKDRRAALVVGLLVMSHWVLDFVSHRPDLPLWPGGPRVGMGLWNSVAATVLLEGTLFAAGVLLYLAATRPRDRTGLWLTVSLVAVLAALYGANAFGGAPPPSAAAVAWVDLALAAIVLPWAALADRHRAPLSPAALAGRP